MVKWFKKEEANLLKILIIGNYTKIRNRVNNLTQNAKLFSNLETY